MSQITKHFNLNEFTRSDYAKKYNIDNTPNQEQLFNIKMVAILMETVRNILGSKPLIITSGFRSKELNKAIGGVSNSAHTEGYAVDFYCNHLDIKEAASILEASMLIFDQLILESSRKIIHLSFDPKLRRDTLTQKYGAGSSFKKGLV
mgnify:FL=1